MIKINRQIFERLQTSVEFFKNFSDEELFTFLKFMNPERFVDADIIFKENTKFVISTPDVTKHTIPNFMILASDGLWCVFSNEDAISFILKQHREGKTAQEISVALVEKAIELEQKKYNKTDDTTAIVVVFEQKNKE